MIKRICIKRRHIADGQPMEADSCPIAMAISERSKIYDVEILPTKATIRRSTIKGDRVQVYKLPKRAKNFIKKFDSNKPVKPFSFTLGKLMREYFE